MNIFKTAMAEMVKGSVSYTVPKSFRDYVESIGAKTNSTAQYISIDSLARLNPDLRENGIMVFRLGSLDSQRTTHFALAKYQQSWADFFLIDQEIFAQTIPEIFIPKVPMAVLYPFFILPRFAESSSVNFASSSGLLSRALRLDGVNLTSAPARGQGTYTFSVRPHSLLDGVVWEHSNGQVEVDGVFLGRRDGQEYLFVLESKFSNGPDSLAKHKLLYSLMAIHSSVSKYIKLIPVYMRVINCSKEIHYYIAECNHIDPDTASVDLIEPAHVCHYVVSKTGYSFLEE